MVKRWAALALMLATLCPAALAEVYAGSTVPLNTLTLRAETGGVVETAIEAGVRVEAGDTLLQTKPDRTFATQDGTVSLVYAEAGDTADGAVLELMPVQRYTVHCTMDRAYQSAASTRVRSGETLYIRCTTDGTHRAMGTVAKIDGSEYRVYTLAGELYVGETVYLYRDADFTAAERVGIGTVVVSDTEVYEAEGTLSLLRVAPGDTVERGQLLYAIGGETVAAPAGGIVASVACRPGDDLAAGQTAVELVPDGEVGAVIRVDEATAVRVSVGDTAQLTFADREDETVPGVVESVAAIAESDLYTVYIRPQTDRALPLGMTVGARL